MKIVGKFKLGRNVYVIVLKNNKYRVGRLEGNLVNYNLSDEEKKLIMVIIDKILPKDNGIKLPSFNLDGKIYDVMVSNNVYMFSSEPNKNDLRLLNNIFNSQSEYMYFGKEIDKDSKFIKRFLKLGKKTLLILLSSTIVLSMSSSLKNDIQEQFSDEVDISQKIDSDKLITIIEEPEIKYEEPEVIEIDDLPTQVVEEIQSGFDKVEANNKVYEASEDTEVIKEDAFNFDDVVEAVNSNPNLTQEEKSVMLSNPKIFEDNYGYYNYAKLLELLNTIKVIYYPDTNDVAGTYNLLTNVMKLYDGTCLEEISKSTFTHEFSHMIQNTNPNYGNSFWDEGINAIANNEYYCSDRENDGSNYSFQSSVIRALDLIIGGDVFRKYYTNNDLNAIKSELYRIYPDEEKANEFMALANYYQCLFFTQIYNLPFTDYDMTQEEVANLIFQDLTFYYETKYGRSVESDLVMLFFVNNNLFKEKIGNMYDFPDSDIYYTILFDKPSIVNPDEKNKAYSFKVVKQNIVSYNEESYEECVSGGLINEAGEPVIKGLIIDKENNKVLRPQYDRKEMLIEINDENRFINDDLNR